MNPQPTGTRTRTLEVLSDIEAELRAVETAIEQALASRDRLVGEVSTHLLRAGGKRIRPALVLLSAKFPGFDLEQVIPVAVAVELIHMATLVHDDVVDKAALRRGIPTVNAQWNNQVSVLTGDYLFAKAFSTLAHTGNTDLVRTMADVVFEMSRGELVQMASYYDLHQTEEDYLQRIAQKTAFLIAESCHLGALMGGGKPDDIQALYNYGYGLGMSFQIADDLLDYMGSTGAVGKPVFGDLKAGILTLPVLHGMRESPRAGELRDLVAARSLGESDLIRVKEILEAAGSFQYARQKADFYLEHAVAELAKVPDLATRGTLHLLADFVINREF